jgi:hypothetical protein
LFASTAIYVCKLLQLAKAFCILKKDELATGVPYVINIAGSRESKSPGVGKFTEKILTKALSNFMLLS